MLLGRRLGPQTEEERRLTKVAPGIYVAKDLRIRTVDEAIKAFFDPSPIVGDVNPAKEH